MENKIFCLNQSFWIDLTKELISGISIGFVIALIGYLAWKRQHHYSKKIDAYICLISSLEEIQRRAINFIVYGTNDIHARNSLVEFFLDNSLIIELQRNKMIFLYYYGELYLDNIEYFLQIEQNIRNVELKIITENSIITKKISDSEINTHVLNTHLQNVINKMHVCMSELKSVSSI